MQKFETLAEFIPSEVKTKGVKIGLFVEKI